MATRAYVILPEELLKEVDLVAGRHNRNRFVREAVVEKLARERQSAALWECAGILDPADYPEWGTPEKPSAWVRAARQQDKKGLRRKLGDRAE